MLKTIISLILAATLAFVMIEGCTDRGTNSSGKVTSGGQLMEGLDHDFFQELYLQIGRNTSVFHGTRVPLQIKMYVPEISIPWINPGAQPEPVPLLVLLPPQDGNAYYFFNHGLLQLANELIAEGTIKPMAIACVENDPFFGGYFYAGRSFPAGDYDTLIGGTLIEYLYDNSQGILSRSLPAGIGGVGMGGYGAFRAALMHEGVFTSISVTDGPYDFDGSAQYSGLDDLFEEVLNEQGLLGGTSEPPEIDTFWEHSVWQYDTTGWDCTNWSVDTTWDCTAWDVDTLTGDSTCTDSTATIDSTCIDSTAVIDSTYYDSLISYIDTTWPPSWRNNFDTAGVWHLSRLFIGGALAFSPHDTFIDTTNTFTYYPLDGTHSINIPDSQRFVLDDTVTLITDVVTLNQFDFDFHLPFDSSGQAYAPIWNMWLANNLETILADSGAAQLDGVKMWFGITSDYSFGNYHDQTLSWIQTLRDNGFSPTIYEYQGYPGNPATNDQYLYDIMREMLIFHSKAFEGN